MFQSQVNVLNCGRNKMPGKKKESKKAPKPSKKPKSKKAMKKAA
jgi:hypothetical protein